MGEGDSHPAPYTPPGSPKQRGQPPFVPNELLERELDDPELDEDVAMRDAEQLDGDDAVMEDLEDDDDEDDGDDEMEYTGRGDTGERKTASVRPSFLFNPLPPVGAHQLSRLLIRTNPGTSTIP